MEISFEQIARWLPMATDPLTVENFVGNKNLYPQTFPETELELWMEQAWVRERLRNKQISPAGGKIDIPKEIQRVSRTAQEMMLLVLDVMEPRGIIEIENLGTAINFSWRSSREGNGQAAKNQNIIAEVNVDFGFTERQKLNLSEDEIVVLPVAEGKEINLEIKTKKGASLDGQKRLKAKVKGGMAGVVFDMRGRPLCLPTNDSLGRKRIMKWREALC